MEKSKQGVVRGRLEVAVPLAPHGDGATVDRPAPPYRQALTGDICGGRLGLPKECFFERLDPEVEAGVRVAITVLQWLGASLDKVSLPHLRNADAIHNPIILAEVARAHAPYLRTRPDAYLPDMRIGL